MKTNRFFAICIVTLTMACKKDTLIESYTPKVNNNPVVPQDTVSQDSVSTYQSLNDFFIQNSAPKQLFTVNPTVFNTIYGSKGGKIHLQPNGYVDSLGNPPTGNISIAYIEVYSIKDMILSNKPTVAGGNILVSGGEIYFKATTSTGNLLTINQYIDILIPTDNPLTGMQVFEGVNNDTTGGVNWLGPDSAWVGLDSIGYYWLNIYQLGYSWINCDQFWSNPNPKTTITLNFASDPQESLDINAYLVFKEINSVMGLYPYTSTTVQAYNIPEGTTPVAVAIGVSVASNKLYFAKTTLTVTTNLTTTLTLTPTTTEELKAALDGL